MKKIIEIHWRGQILDDPTLIICNKEDLKEALTPVTSGSYNNIKSIIIKDLNEDITVKQLIDELRNKISEPTDCELVYDGQDITTISTYTYEIDKYYSFTLITKIVQPGGQNNEKDN